MEHKDLFPSVFIGPRRSGKTTNLLVLSDIKKIPVLVHNRNVKRCLEEQARRIGLKHARVITLAEMKQQKEKVVVVDEAQSLLEQLLGVKIDSASITTYTCIELNEIPRERQLRGDYNEFP
jgi:predicted AAA+ superfamily ATPase